MVDFEFLMAMLGIGWGLSLATYRIVAARNEWPLGEPQRDYPVVPVLIGVVALLIGLLFALLRGAEFGGWWILTAGLLWALFWTGFLRVASQTSLFLAPIATALLVLAWMGIDRPSDLWPALRSSDSAVIAPLPERTPRWFDEERDRAANSGRTQ